MIKHLFISGKAIETLRLTPRDLKKAMRLRKNEIARERYQEKRKKRLRKTRVNLVAIRGQMDCPRHNDF